MRRKQSVFVTVVLLSFFFLAACAITQAPKPTAEEGKLEKMSKIYQKKLERNEEERLRQVLSLKRSYDNSRILVTYPMPQPNTEQNVYREILTAYQARDARKTEFYTREFLKLYPKSVHADNALYLLGNLNLTLGAPSEALRYFERLIKVYPLSNKRASALLEKGIAYRKMQLFKYAEKVFAEVKREFPGSPEFFKVELELKLLQVEKGA